MVSAPSYHGAFDDALDPTVQVCEWDDGSCKTVVTPFTKSIGHGSEVVRVDAAKDQYMVNWETKNCMTGGCTLDPAKTYRLIMLVGEIEWGHADVSMVSNGSQVKGIGGGESIALVNGRTLPVRFRI